MLKSSLIRVDANQGTSLFWGLLSALFFTACCVLLWQQRMSEYNTDALREQVLFLDGRVKDLSSKKERVQADMAEREQALKDQEEILKQEKAKLALTEGNPNGIPDPASPSPTPAPDGTTHPAPKVDAMDAKQLATLKKFVQAAHKLAKNSDELTLQGGRPLLRLPNARLFPVGETTLLPDAKDVLTHLTSAVSGQLDHAELRISVFSDKSGEGEGKSKNDPWALTSSRAVAIQHFLHEQTGLPLNHILCLGLGDSNPLSGKESRRTEFTLVPTPSILPPNALPSLSVLASDAPAKGSTATPPNPLEPPPDAPSKP